MDLSEWLETWSENLEEEIIPKDAGMALDDLDRIAALGLAAASTTPINSQDSENEL